MTTTGSATPAGARETSTAPDLVVIPETAPMSPAATPAAPVSVSEAAPLVAPAPPGSPVVIEPAPLATARSERSVKDLIAVAQRDVSLLISKEVELAKAELAAAGKKAALGSVGLIVAGLVAFFGAIGLLMTFGFALNALGLSLWAAFAVVTLVYFVLAGAAAAFGGLSLKGLKPPVSAINGAKADLAAVRGKR